MPQYQGIWTLAQAAQLQSTQRWATDPLYRNTTLLLQADNAANGAQNNTFLDSSSNNFTITRNGNTTQGTFTPYSLQPGWWGNYFSGSGTGFLNAVSNTVFAFGTGDFTLEAFINVAAYPSAFPGTTAGNIISAHNWNGSGFDFTFRIQPTGLLYFENSAGNTLSSSTAVPLNTWVHVACVRSSGTLTFYINGSSAGVGAAAGSISSTVAISIGAALSGGTYGNFTGYISNARITKGGALYTTAFTPSMTPLTTTVSSGTVSLLTCQSNRFVDNSVNAFSLTAGAGASVQAFSPFAPQYQYTPSVTGGSGYFDGTGDYLSVPSTSNLAFGTGDFCVEFWLYRTGTTGGIFSNSVNSGGGDAQFEIQLNGTNKVVLIGWNTIFMTGATTINTNTWYHIAVVRSGTSMAIFVNGARDATATSSNNFSSTNAFVVGLQAAGSGATTGYISSLRAVKGSFVYNPSSTTVTIPTAPLTAITNTSLLLNFTNAGIVDGTMKNNLETVGNAQVSTSVVKYGTGSMYFDGSGDYLFSPSSVQLNFGSGNFTVEGWFYITSNVSCGLVSKWTDGGNQRGWKLDNRSNNTITFYYSTTGADFPLVTFSNVSLPVNTWSHLALVRNNNVLTLYKDGVNVGSSSFTSTIYANTSQGCVGGWFVSTNTPETAGINAYPGYIDDLRITAGIARYTANFIPPSVALPRQ